MPFNRFNHSVLGEIRPRFSLIIDCEPEIAINHIKKRVIEDNTVSSLRTNHTKEYVFLNTPTWLQHYWSPEMTVRIEKSEITDRTFVYCLIGPRQSVWAMFTLLYAAICILTMFASIYGFVKYQTSNNTTFLWSIPIGFLLFSSVFLVAKAGQKKGRDQMLHLVSFLYHTLDEITSVSRVN